MFSRALLALLVLPGMVAGVLPALLYFLVSARPVYPLAGGVLFLIGLALLLWCVRDFYVAGKGTLAPWDPPQHLVMIGLYRYTRNPMYLAVLCILLGWTIASAELFLLFYFFIFVLVFNLRVIKYEEPWLALTYKADWEEYCSAVPRWLFRLKR